LQNQQEILLTKEMSNENSIKTKYTEVVVPAMQEKFNYKSVMQTPKITKICLNQGVGDAVSDKKLVDAAVDQMTLITGQRAVATMSKKAISNFKLREKMPIGARVTLRGKKMFEFLDRFINVSIPRIRDFQGLPLKGFDGRGNYTIGIKEQIIFPEIDIDKISRITGMDITFVTSAKDDIECLELLRQFGMPFKKDNK